MPETWKTVIVDDERLARNRLRAMLKKFPQIEIVGEADGITSSLQVIGKVAPDLLFLDIQMPGGSGFDLLEKLSVPLKVIFVTAFDQFAAQASKVDAIGYLLKPISENKLALVIEKLYSIECEESQTFQ